MFTSSEMGSTDVKYPIVDQLTLTEQLSTLGRQLVTGFERPDSCTRSPKDKQTRILELFDRVI